METKKIASAFHHSRTNNLIQYPIHSFIIYAQQYTILITFDDKTTLNLIYYFFRLLVLTKRFENQGFI